ncbi:related to Translin [Ustilago trichophora]|uniref:Related to Translin n=1 Tax=Ustilago trichophora TaxID=86804 RepID=A0A5C3DXY5_9BASI|nr:related to Translin [Ustilago trichophora]
MDALTTATGSVAAEFEPLFAELEGERELSDAIREKSKELDRCYRALSSLLNSVHSTKGDAFDGIVERTKPIFAQTRIKVKELGDLVPTDQYYRWCDDFSYPLKNLTSSIALIVLLRTGNLVTKPQASSILGLDSIPSHKVQLATEDYLHALINAINELPRLAVNSVTLGDFRTPVRLATFVKHVHAGFQLLNLKNDSLRKRFDGIKYDVKKIEEIVYDISLRGLIKGEDDGLDGLAFSVGEERQLQLVQSLAQDPVTAT